jgi:hypothetical protein
MDKVFFVFCSLFLGTKEEGTPRRPRETGRNECFRLKDDRKKWNFWTNLDMLLGENTQETLCAILNKNKPTR